MKTFAALHHYPFALLWAGQTTSRLGDAIYVVALAWWVTIKTGSGAALGSVLIVSIVPMLIFLLVGGVMADRVSRLWLMLTSDAARAGLMAIIAVLAATDTLALWHIYIVNLTFGFVRAFFTPAYRAALPDVTPSDLLPSANAVTGLSVTLSGIVGPGIGASIVAFGNIGLAFAINSLSFGVSMVCILTIARQIRSGSIKQKASILGDMREGLVTVASSPWLWVTIVIAAVSNIAYSGPAEVALPFLIKDVLHADVAFFGLISTVSATGAVIGAFWFGRSGHMRRRGVVMYGSWALIGVMVFACSLPITIYGVLAAWLLIGVADAMLGLVWVATLQEQVPKDLLGRVSSVDYLGSYLFMPVGYAIGGWATDVLGAQQVFLVGGVLMVGVVLLGLAHPQVRGMD